MPKLLFLIAEDRYFWSHRLNLGKAAVKAGYQVALATRSLEHLAQIEALGIQVFPLHHFTRGGLNPFRQLLSLKELYSIYKTYKPDIAHHVAMKPIVLGTLIATWLKVPRIINAFGGLGYLFTDSSKQRSLFTRFKKASLRFCVSYLLRFLFSANTVSVVLQNKDDKNTLIQATHLSPSKITLIPGAGIDIDVFKLSPMPPLASPIIITCIARLLWDKGIGELVLAAKILKEQSISAQVVLYGMPDSENPASIDKSQLLAWHAANDIIWRGYCTDVVKAYADSHIAVLPSYREGLPKSLLEAASCGRPIVTTDVPGCREVVAHGENGYLVPKQNAQALANALITLCNDSALRFRMGLAGRKRVENIFQDALIQQQTLALYRS